VRRISSGSPYEPLAGYSRAVAAGGFVFVSGCTAVRDGEVTCPGDAYGQTAEAIRVIETALSRLGAGLADVVRTRIYVTDIERWQEYGRAHREAFGAAPPATSMVEVARLIDPRMLVEVEAVAWRPGAGRAPGGLPDLRASGG